MELVVDDEKALSELETRVGVRQGFFSSPFGGDDGTFGTNHGRSYGFPLSSGFVVLTVEPRSSSGVHPMSLST